MGNYTGPKVRLSRKLGVPIADTPKHQRPRNPNPPGQARSRRRKKSLYRQQLEEKQKIAFYYNIREEQLRRYLDMANKSAGNNIAALFETLETRLDNVVRRLGWARTIWQARQVVVHGHIMVNGRRVDRPSFAVSPGDEISVREKSKKVVDDLAELAEAPEPPAWISVDQNKKEASIERMPVQEDGGVPFEVNFGHVVEYYSR